MCAEAYLEPLRKSEMENFVEIVNSIKLLTIFAKKLHLRHLQGFKQFLWSAVKDDYDNCWQDKQFYLKKYVQSK